MAAEALPYTNPDPFDLDSPPALKVLTPADSLPPVIGPEYWAQFAEANQAKRQKIRDDMKAFKERGESAALRDRVFQQLHDLAYPREEGRTNELVTLEFTDGSLMTGLCTALANNRHNQQYPSMRIVLNRATVWDVATNLETTHDIRSINAIHTAIELSPD